jgi:hypothetical protein
MLGCSSPIHVERFSESSRHPVRKLAVVPFEARIPQTSGMTATEISTYVTSRVLGALSEQEQFVVIPPAEVLHALGARDGSALPSERTEVGRAVSETFGVDALVFGEVRRFTKRSGGAKGSSRPASVRFDLELHGADGTLLWRGVYDETQRSISEDLGGFSVARSRGFRWLSAEELAEYGAGELVGAMSEAFR